MSKRIYCDYNATTPILPIVQKAFMKGLSFYGNASSLYALGREAKEVMESTRESLAAILGCYPDQLIFTSSGTESNNQVLKSLIYDKVVLKKDVHILISAIEHSSIFDTVKVLLEYGVEYDVVPVTENGKIDIDAYKALFRTDTRLVSIMMANNEIGQVQDIELLCQIAREKSVLFHTDAVQAFGKMDVKVTDLGVDFLSLSAHKIYAPKGLGVLFVKDDSMLKPLLDGAHHERSMRASTENIPSIFAFKTALEQLDVASYQAHTADVRSTFVSLLKAHIPDIVFHHALAGLTNTVSVSFEGVFGHHLAMNCDLEGIDVSTGSACSVGAIEPSHVLRAIGVADDINQSTLRFSFGLMSTKQECEDVVHRLKRIIARMRS